MRETPFVDSLRPYQTQVGSDLVSQHFLQTYAEQVWCIAAVWPRHYITAHPCGASRPSMTSGATVADTSSERQINVDVPDAIICQRALSLATQKLPLEELTTSSNRTKWIASNDKRRGIRCGPVPGSAADLLCQRFGNSEIGNIGILRAVIQLGQSRRLTNNCDCAKGSE